MTPSDFERISRLRQELKQAIELLSASQKPSVTSPVLQPVSSRPVSSMNSKKGGGSGLGAIPSVRRAQSSVLARTSLGSVEDSDGTPTPSPKSLRAPTTAATRTSWLARRSSVVPSAPTSSSAPGPVAAHPLMFTQEVDHSSIAARIYHISCYDRPNQRILIHGGLRRDKPSRLCVSQIFALDLSESRKGELKYSWQVEVSCWLFCCSEEKNTVN
jgi:hypothetical protein